MKHPSRSRRRLARRIFGTRFPLRMETLEARIAPVVVTSLNDFGTGTLRQAILNANSSGGDTITFDSSLFPSGGGTVTINLNSPIQSSGTLGPTEFDITSAIIIQGPTTPGDQVVINNINSESRVFTVESGGSLTLSNVTVSGGTLTGYAGYGIGGVSNGGGGGGAAHGGSDLHEHGGGHAERRYVHRQFRDRRQRRHRLDFGIRRRRRRLGGIGGAALGSGQLR